MVCIVCGTAEADYLCSIKGMGVALCCDHLCSSSWDTALRTPEASN